MCHFFWLTLVRSADVSDLALRPPRMPHEIVALEEVLPGF